MDENNHMATENTGTDSVAIEAWVKPEIVTFEPAKAAEGISYNPNDGIANLT